MIDRLTPRGPDASGSWISPNALIAHKRLIVVDPEGGIQPMVRRQGENTYVITYNGNFTTLRTCETNLNPGAMNF